MKYPSPFKHLKNSYYKALGYYPATIHGHQFRCDPYHRHFWGQAASGSWEPDTYRILSKYLDTNSIFYDIGAWIGPTSIYAAKLCKKVICFEPDPVAFQYLVWNIQLNSLTHVVPFCTAMSDCDAVFSAASFGKSLGDSQTSLLNPKSSSGSIDVLALSWNTWLQMTREKRIDFLKMDIEGGEFVLLPAIREYLSIYKPTLYLSTHLPYLAKEDRPAYVRLIASILKLYSSCFDHLLRPIDPSAVAEEATLSGFRSFVCTA